MAPISYLCNSLLPSLSSFPLIISALYQDPVNIQFFTSFLTPCIWHQIVRYIFPKSVVKLLPVLISVLSDLFHLCYFYVLQFCFQDSVMFYNSLLKPFSASNSATEMSAYSFLSFYSLSSETGLPVSFISIVSAPVSVYCLSVSGVAVAVGQEV